MASVNIEKWGSNEKILKIVLENEYLKAEISTLGAALVALNLKKTADQRDIVCGLKSPDDYLNHDKYLGATVGRVAGRIDAGRFVLNGREYTLAQNNNGNALHGGIKGFDRKVFSYEILRMDNDAASVKLSIISLDMEEGYPGNLMLDVIYEIVNNRLSVRYEGRTDGDTLINITNHSYFNLNGHNGHSIKDHSLRVKSEEILKIDEDGCARGERLKVEKTPFDFREYKLIGNALCQAHEQIVKGNGIDHYFIFNGDNSQIELLSPDSKIKMTVDSDQLGANIYTANYLNDLIGKDNVLYTPRCSICFECQDYVNDININAEPGTVLRVGEKYTACTNYIFEVKE